MTAFDIAKSYLGIKEIAGPRDNPKIMEMYASVGHDWVEHDETAWCAAFVGHCLEKAGIRSTRALNARSYLTFGEPVAVTDAREGDIVVFERGSSSWQGHVAFFIKATATQIEVLGGNQSNGVTIARYPRSRLLGIRRPIGVRSSAKPSLRVIQQTLEDLGYHEVGAIDGLFGPRTRAAILAFKADNGLPLTPDIDVAFTTALEKAPPRVIAPERASGKPQASRIVSAANAQIATGIAGTITIAGAAIAPAIEAAEQAKDMTERAIGLLNLTEFVAPFLPWIGIAIFAVVIVLAWRARTARIEDYRTGRTP
ncbi:MAG TPA: TIGR02594 family protein [Bauldia sp.]|nr:TIGR02594 family protein [Bauldia sp.]